MNGKGSKRRPTEYEKQFRDNWDKAFPPKEKK